MSTKNDEFELYRKTLETSENYKLPTVCISVFENKLIFTTKKVGSRYFEDISIVRDSNNHHNNSRRSIDFYVLPNIESNKLMPDYDSRLVIGKYYFNVTPHSFLNVDTFFNIVGIKNLSELFNESTHNTWEFIFIVRDPLKRTLTGFCEIADSYFSSLMTNAFSKEIAQKYFQIVLGATPSISFKDLPIEKVVDILNEYSAYIGPDLIRDEHTSAWCVFLSSFIREHKLEKKIKVIDLADADGMSIFPKIPQPSNKNYLKEWMNIRNRFFVENMLKSIDFFLLPETEAYKELLQIK